MLHCRHLARRKTRHNALLDDIHKWLLARGVLAEKEYPVGCGQNRVDHMVRCDGVVTWTDVTVTEPARDTVLSHTANEAGYAAYQAERKKILKWTTIATELSQHVDFVPLAFEATGRRGAQTDAWLRKMTKLSLSSHGPSLDSLCCQLSVTMAKYNVAMVREAVNGATP
jgi:hypothetical protein